jgi:hypothetical protein
MKNKTGQIRYTNQDSPLRRKGCLAVRKAVANALAPAYRPRKEGYANWMTLAVKGFK